MLRLSNISKAFGATQALRDVSLSVAAGEIVAIVGENGAGKTTLMRIAAGELAPDSGARDAIGIELVHQHFMLVNQLTTAENLALAAPFRFTTRRSLERTAAELIAASGIALDHPSRRVAELSVGEQAKLELIKAVARKPRVLVLDEPTAVLTPSEAAELFAVMRRMAAEGTAIVFISHKLPEVLAVAQRIAVMRRGAVVAESAAEQMTAQQIAAAMVGTIPTRAESDAHRAMASAARGESGAPRTVLRATSVAGRSLQSVTCEVSAGEVVAIVGVAGNGQSELAAMVRGLERPRAGTLSIEAGATGYIPEDRTRYGLVAQMTLAENVALTAGRWDARRAASDAKRLIDLYAIRAESPHQLAGQLSGGNQQKLILARELDRNPELILAAEPTRGLDLDATRFVHEQLRAAAARGAAVLLITSDLDEAFALADALHVIYRGRLSERLTPQLARTQVASLMAGVA